MRFVKKIFVFAVPFALALMWGTAAFRSPVFAEDPTKESDRIFFVGGYGDGIYVAKYRSSDGSVSKPTLACKISNPSYLSQHPTLPVIYAVRETSRAETTKGNSAIFAFRWNPVRLQLEQLSETTINGDSPCHVSVDSDGKFALVANYSSGCVLLYAINEDGSIEKELDHVQHETRKSPSGNADPRAHSIRMDPTNQWTVVADLGLDRVFVYRFDREKGKLLGGPKFNGLTTEPGAGPRQIAFHPSGKYLFVINESNSTLTAASWNPETGKLIETSTVSTLPPDFKGRNSTAAVVVNASGDKVYGSNRGHDSIAAFHFDETSGKLRSIGHQSTEGKTPRDFRITPDGLFLLAENQESDSIVVLSIDEKTGLLAPTGKRVEVPAPACIEFLNIQK